MRSRRRYAERKSADDITIARYAKENLGVAPELRASMPALTSARILRHGDVAFSNEDRIACPSKKRNWTAFKNFLAPPNGKMPWKLLATKRRQRAAKKSTENLNKVEVR